VGEHDREVRVHNAVPVTAGGNGLQTQGVCIVISPGKAKTTTTAAATTASLSFARSAVVHVGGGITIGGMGGGVSPGWNTQTGLPSDGCSTVTEITPGGAESCYSLSWRRK